MQLINGGLRRDIHRQYNFVLLTDGKFRIAEVGGNTFREHLGKHAILAKNARFILSAGDLMVHDGKVVLSNGSGTYTPEIDSVEKTAQALCSAFSGLQVEATKFDSDLHKAAMKNVGQPFKSERDEAEIEDGSTETED